MTGQISPAIDASPDDDTIGSSGTGWQARNEVSLMNILCIQSLI